MTLRRYTPLKPSRGTVIPPEMKLEVFQRDGGCVGAKCFPGDCQGGLEADHVRASHGISMKSDTIPSNLVSLCGAHHRYKTEHGKIARPILLAYLDLVGAEHRHVDPVPGCAECYQAFG